MTDASSLSAQTASELERLSPDTPAASQHFSLSSNP